MPTFLTILGRKRRSRVKAQFIWFREINKVIRETLMKNRKRGFSFYILDRIATFPLATSSNSGPSSKRSYWSISTIKKEINGWKSPACCTGTCFSNQDGQFSQKPLSLETQKGTEKDKQMRYWSYENWMQGSEEQPPIKNHSDCWELLHGEWNLPARGSFACFQ